MKRQKKIGIKIAVLVLLITLDVITTIAINKTQHAVQLSKDL